MTNKRAAAGTTTNCHTLLPHTDAHTATLPLAMSHTAAVRTAIRSWCAHYHTMLHCRTLPRALPRTAALPHTASRTDCVTLPHTAPNTTTQCRLNYRTLCRRTATRLLHGCTVALSHCCTLPRALP
jgi:hypothetical protein